MDLHQIQLHDIDSEGNDILLSPKNRAKDVTVTDMDEDYNFGESYLKNDISLSENLSIINKLISSSIHTTNGNEDGVGFVKVATFIPRGNFSKICYIDIDIIANNSKSLLELCFEKDTINTVNLSYFRYDESPINAKLVYDSRIRTYTLYIEKTIEYSSVYIMNLKSTLSSDMISVRWENSMYEGPGIVGATAQIVPHSSYIKESKTAPDTTDCFWNDTSTSPSVMKYWDGEKWSQFSVGGSGGTTTSITLDDVMSNTSVNGVQNRIIKNYVDSLIKDVDDSIANKYKEVKEYIDKKSSSIDDDNISKETVWSSKKIHDLKWTGTMDEYERDKDNIPEGATVNITDDYDENASSNGADIDDTSTSRTKTWSSDKISKMIWSGTFSEYELKKDSIPEGTVINIEDDYEEVEYTTIDDTTSSKTTTWSSDKIKGLTWSGTTEEYEKAKDKIPDGTTVNITDDEDEIIDDNSESANTTWSSQKIKGLMWSGTSEEYDKVKNTIPEGALVNITDDEDAIIDDNDKSNSTTWSSEKISKLSWSGTTEEYEKVKNTIPEGTTVNITDDEDAIIDDTTSSKTTTWSSDKIKGLTWSGTTEEYEKAKATIPEGALVNITDDYDDSGSIDDNGISDFTTWSSKKIKGLMWSGTSKDYESVKASIPEGALVNITDDYDDSGSIDDTTSSKTTTWSSDKIKGLTWSGTTEEYEKAKSTIADGTTVNITDDEDEIIDDTSTSKDSTWSSDKIKGLTWTGTMSEYEKSKNDIPEGATVNITDDIVEDIKINTINITSQYIKTNNSSIILSDNRIGELILNIELKSLTKDNEIILFSLENLSLYSDISEFIFTKDKKFAKITIDKSGVVKLVPNENIDENDFILKNFLFIFETKL